MLNQELNNKINLFRSLFKGREDVFAIRWEKGAKSGYMPSYFYDPYVYRLHKIKGGTFQNYADKSYLPLTNEQIAKHLTGMQLTGLYPLLQDNTSWFIAADFDKQIEKSIPALPACLKEIDQHLDLIRKQGRQVFLTSPPENFTRILHDYSDEQKGFVIWKDCLEEKLV